MYFRNELRHHVSSIMIICLCSVTVFSGAKSHNQMSCSFSGKSYSRGDTWYHLADNPKGPICLACHCQENGQVNCTTNKCGTQLCSYEDDIDERCCKKCTDVEIEDTNTREHMLGTFTFTDKTRNSRNDCLSGGQIYSQNATWHPVIGPLGQMDCVVCKCQLGKVVCNRLSCKETKTSLCAKVAHVLGHCCPICVNEEKMTDFSEQHLSQKEFDVLKTKFTFTLLGATKTKLMDRFIKKSKKLTNRCTSGCHGKIARMENVLRLKKFPGNLCVQSERKHSKCKFRCT
ncbi:chordin-like protein 1 isoform X5 [Tachypleus tridentatus]|uniref:chordin-like protein 1 isoform X5 n=1 Tax=Tachypleus tridentatus TaxID=6853 RepID=UPI003FD030FB